MFEVDQELAIRSEQSDKLISALPCSRAANEFVLGDYIRLRKYNYVDGNPDQLLRPALVHPVLYLITEY